LQERVDFKRGDLSTADLEEEESEGRRREGREGKEAKFLARSRWSLSTQAWRASTS
jgi:hypothetical protein